MDINLKNCRRIEALPERLPTINWEEYKNQVKEEDIGVVCDFEDRYKKLEAQIPYPIDVVDTHYKIDCIKKEYKGELQDFKNISETKILKLEEEKKRIADMIPFEEMTLEEFRDNWPDRAIDPINKPTFWPHTADEQELPKPHKPADPKKKGVSKTMNLFKKKTCKA